MKFLLFAALLFPVCCFSQHFSPKVQLGAGYAYYTGSATAGNINGDYAKVGLKSGFTGEATVSQRVLKFLHVGLGGSLLKFDHTNTYAPVFAEIKAMGGGKLKPYAFVRPGYGIYRGHYDNAQLETTLPAAMNGPSQTQQRGAFYMGYGVGIVLHAFYLQATYHRLRFNTKNPTNAPVVSTDSYGIIALTAGVRLP